MTTHGNTHHVELISTSKSNGYDNGDENHSKFNSNEWIDKGRYWVNIHPQGTSGWKSARTMLTASKIAAAIGKSPFMTREQLLEDLSRSREKDISHLTRIQRGIDTEPKIRDYYNNYIAKPRGHHVIEFGVIVPKFDSSIGGSIDGAVVDVNGKIIGIIEIKCTDYVYTPLVMRSYIYTNHYLQMLGGMAIVGVPWCDYIVYGYEERRIAIRRVYFKPKEWEVVYNDIKKFNRDLDRMRRCLNDVDDSKKNSSSQEQLDEPQ